MQKLVPRDVSEQAVMIRQPEDTGIQWDEARTSPVRKTTWYKVVLGIPYDIFPDFLLFWTNPDKSLKAFPSIVISLFSKEETDER